jgi:hypothetical protein
LPGDPEVKAMLADIHRRKQLLMLLNPFMALGSSFFGGGGMEEFFGFGGFDFDDDDDDDDDYGGW